MAYQKTKWVNDSEPYISAENLNKIEDGISNADANATAAVEALNGYKISIEDGHIVLTK